LEAAIVPEDILDGFAVFGKRRNCNDRRQTNEPALLG
jgi:hypothetical protein